MWNNHTSIYGRFAIASLAMVVSFGYTYEIPASGVLKVKTFAPARVQLLLGDATSTSTASKH